MGSTLPCVLCVCECVVVLVTIGAIAHLFGSCSVILHLQIVVGVCSSRCYYRAGLVECELSRYACVDSVSQSFVVVVL